MKPVVKIIIIIIIIEHEVYGSMYNTIIHRSYIIYITYYTDIKI